MNKIIDESFDDFMHLTRISEEIAGYLLCIIIIYYIVTYKDIYYIYEYYNNLKILYN